jgi:hypothetical protein
MSSQKLESFNLGFYLFFYKFCKLTVPLKRFKKKPKINKLRPDPADLGRLEPAGPNHMGAVGGKMAGRANRPVPLSAAAAAEPVRVKTGRPIRSQSTAEGRLLPRAQLAREETLTGIGRW